MEPDHRKTREAWHDPGHAHFITYSCHGRLPLLTRARTRQWVIEAMEETRKELDVAFWAYVIMPEHVHVLLRPMRPDYKLPQILASLKRGVSQKAKTFLEQNGELRWLARLTVRYPSRTVFRFWLPGGGNDHNVFRDRTVPHIMRYIHENPVRRGLAKDPREWAWSSAGFWAGSSELPIRMDQPDL